VWAKSQNSHKQHKFSSAAWQNGVLASEMRFWAQYFFSGWRWKSQPQRAKEMEMFAHFWYRLCEEIGRIAEELSEEA
jgi:hypothetical protein